ncbi:hypothetical protein AGMMS49579_26840 [Spirochaetia bacterium]|nr:hypothetical protein AGMMS49579_26840 [Spirochaetia bacterium]
MIFFWAKGRLGNQIFQYAFLQSIRSADETVIGFNFNELEIVFEKINIINIRCNSRIRRFCINYILKQLIKFFTYIKIFSNISACLDKIIINGNEYLREGDKIIHKKGLFSNIKYVHGYFQSEIFFKKEKISDLMIKQSYLNIAKEIIRPITKDTLFFIHIRIGDYKTYTVYGKSALLPMDYFHKCIEYLIKSTPGAYFIFISDNPDSIEMEFSYLKNKMISINPYPVDFALMTLCNGAILSPSSFGWWGSYFMKIKHTVLAPEHWLGFSSKIDYHKNPLAPYMMPVF